MAPIRQLIVYGLLDPRTHELRYVGKSERGLAVRLKEHSMPSRLCAGTYVTRWVRQLREAGLRPLGRVLEVCTSPDELYASEQRLIAFFRKLGHRLTNGTDGGRGWSGLRHSAATKELCRQANLGRPRPAEHRARISASKTGATIGPQTDEHRRRIAAARGRPFVDDLGRAWVSQREAGRFYGVFSQNIGAVLHGRAITAAGRVFRYLEVD